MCACVCVCGGRVVGLRGSGGKPSGGRRATNELIRRVDAIAGVHVHSGWSDNYEEPIQIILLKYFKRDKLAYQRRRQSQTAQIINK